MQGGLYVASASIYTYRLEMFSANRRFIATSCDFGWMLGSLLLPLTVYLVPVWRLVPLSNGGGGDGGGGDSGNGSSGGSSGGG